MSQVAKTKDPLAAFVARPRKEDLGVLPLWMEAHSLALREPSGPNERRIVALLRFVGSLAQDYEGDVYVSKNILAPLLSGALCALNLPLGRIDGGICDAGIRRLATDAGLDGDAL